MTLYEGMYYLIKETKQPKYLDFYELEEKDLNDPVMYLEQTVRYAGKWYFITTKTRCFDSENERDSAPKVYIKNLYQKKKPLMIGK